MWQFAHNKIHLFNSLKTVSHAFNLPLPHWSNHLHNYLDSYSFFSIGYIPKQTMNPELTREEISFLQLLIMSKLRENHNLPERTIFLQNLEQKLREIRRNILELRGTNVHVRG